MKKLLLTASFVTIVAMGAVKADPMPAPKIGIVEQATLNKSAAVKSIMSQIDKKRGEVQKEIAALEKDLKAQDKQLSEDQKKLSEKEFADKRQAFEKRVRDAQEKLEIRKAQMELALTEANKKVFEAFLKAAEDIKKQVGVNVIIYKETVVTADPSFDLTPQILDKLNKDLPTVQVVYKSEADVKKQLHQPSQM